MKKLTDTKSISALLKNDKVVKIIVAAGFALMILILLSDLLRLGGSGEQSFQSDSAMYARQIEEQLVGILSQVQGVGRIKVMVTLESFDGNGMPKVRGVAVVCEGGDDVLVKQKVVETVSKALGISTARVSVVY
ncbi:MAG: hypothetical protein LBC82_03100 [Oscillospiraceae bacterium]|jgi:stage III sporulation protein AG|nr:hypothetical protein [Oscillospiraceae bacterium]